jgi:uncharacterized protein (DUF2345 family)
MASAERDTAAKSFKSGADQANVYVYRLSAAAMLVKFPVSLDGKYLGELAVGTFAHASVAPGQHTVLSSGENQATFTFTVAAGQNVFIKAEPNIGWTAAGISLLPRTDPEEAMQEVMRCSLVKGAD